MRYEIYLRSREQPVSIEADSYEFVELSSGRLLEYKRETFTIASFRAEEVQGFVQHIPESIIQNYKEITQK